MVFNGGSWWWIRAYSQRRVQASFRAIKLTDEVLENLASSVVSGVGVGRSSDQEYSGGEAMKARPDGELLVFGS